MKKMGVVQNHTVARFFLIKVMRMTLKSSPGPSYEELSVSSILALILMGSSYAQVMILLLLI